MRYLPHTDDTRREMLDAIGVAGADALFADVPALKLLKELLDLPRAKSEMAVERALSALAARNIPAGSVPFFAGCGAYKHHVPATVDHLIQRSRVPDRLHALSAGNRAGHAAIYCSSSRRQVAAADRHGGRQRLDVRRLDRGGRGRADGAPADQAQEGGAVGRLASALPRRDRDDSALFRRIGVEAGPRGAGEELRALECDEDTSCVVVQMPDVFGRVRRSFARSPKRHTRRARCWSWWSRRPCRLAR